MKSIFRISSFSVVVLSFLWWMSCSKTNPSDTVIPLKALELVAVTDLPFKEPSGIAFSSALQKLWIVSGETQRIYATDTNGTVDKRLRFEGIDLEGITFDESDSTLWVVDESTMVLTHLDLDGNVLFQKQLIYSLESNDGPEGVAFGENHALYVLNEKNPSLLIALDTAYEITQTWKLAFAFDYSDITFDNLTGTFFILSDESKAFFRLNEQATVFEQYNLPNDKYEGIAYDARREVFYLVNDAANTLSKFKVKQ